MWPSRHATRAPEDRSDRDVTILRDTIEKFRGQRRGFRRNIEKQFPGYADLVTPRAATVDDIRAALKPGEAFMSFYLGRRASFVWAVPKVGQVALPCNFDFCNKICQEQTLLTRMAKGLGLRMA